MKTAAFAFRTNCIFVIVIGLSLAVVSMIASSNAGTSAQPTLPAMPGQSLGIVPVPSLRDFCGYQISDGATVAPGKEVHSRAVT